MNSIKGVEFLRSESPNLSDSNGGYSTAGVGMMKRPNVASGQSGLHSPGEKQPNFILVCLEHLVPVMDRLVQPQDRPLLDLCLSKLGMVSMLHISYARYCRQPISFSVVGILESLPYKVDVYEGSTTCSGTPNVDISGTKKNCPD